MCDLNKPVIVYFYSLKIYLSNALKKTKTKNMFLRVKYHLLALLKYTQTHCNRKIKKKKFK